MAKVRLKGPTRCFFYICVYFIIFCLPLLLFPLLQTFLHMFLWSLVSLGGPDLSGLFLQLGYLYLPSPSQHSYILLLKRDGREDDSTVPCFTLFLWKISFWEEIRSYPSFPLLRGGSFIFWGEKQIVIHENDKAWMNEICKLCWKQKNKLGNLILVRWRK